jgi:hypothetical protein
MLRSYRPTPTSAEAKQSQHPRAATKANQLLLSQQLSRPSAHRWGGVLAWRSGWLRVSRLAAYSCSAAALLFGGAAVLLLNSLATPGSPLSRLCVTLKQPPGPGVRHRAPSQPPRSWRARTSEYDWHLCSKTAGNANDDTFALSMQGTRKDIYERHKSLLHQYLPLEPRSQNPNRPMTPRTPTPPE